MNVYKYFSEIKNRSFLLILTWISVILVSYCFKEVLLFTITKPSIYLSFYTSSSSYESIYFIFTDVIEIFLVYISLIFFIGNQIASLFMLYHFLFFVALGLYKFEYNYLTFIFKISLFFFMFSIVIYNKFLFPFSWNFFLSFQEFAVLKFLTLHFESKINEYITFYITFYYLCIVYFQIFVFLVLFFDYVKDDLKTVKIFRKFFYYSFVIFSTLITPPDIFSQFILSINIIVNYEILMFFLIIKNVIKKF